MKGYWGIQHTIVKLQTTMNEEPQKKFLNVQTILWIDATHLTQLIIVLLGQRTTWPCLIQSLRYWNIPDTKFKDRQLPEEP